jgi:hypothetical protein
MKKQGIKLSRVHASVIKTKLKKSGSKPAHAKPVAEAPAPVESRVKANGTITVAQIREVAATINALGGYRRMNEVLDVIREAGGTKKFSDLAEAMRSAEGVG